ncbi:hypothetical protein V6N13_024328 [Hibiscus sabdariffa]
MRANRDESWRWHKERTGKVDRTRSRKKGNMEESGDSVTGKALRPYRPAVGVAAKDKVEVLDSCVVAWCKRGLRGEALVAELQRASVGVCSVMRAASDCVLLMFSSDEERRVFLDITDFDQWFDRYTVWNPGSFERARFLMETSWMERIEETVELVEGEDSVTRVQVQEVEVIHSHDMVCSCDMDSAGESEGGAKEDRFTEFQVVPMSGLNPLFGPSGEGGGRQVGEVRELAGEFDMVGIVCRAVPPEPRMCEPEWWVHCSSELRGLEAAGELAVPRIEWREPVAVVESVSKSTLGGHPAVNLNFELEQIDILTGDLGGGGVENFQQTAITEFPSIELVQHNGLTRKVRSVNSLVVDSLPAEQRDQLLKRQGRKNRGRPQRERKPNHSFANESLTDSDFAARKTAILCWS